MSRCSLTSVSVSISPWTPVVAATVERGFAAVRRIVVHRGRPSTGESPGRAATVGTVKVRTAAGRTTTGTVGIHVASWRPTESAGIAPKLGPAPHRKRVVWIGAVVPGAAVNGVILVAVGAPRVFSVAVGFAPGTVPVSLPPVVVPVVAASSRAPGLALGRSRPGPAALSLLVAAAGPVSVALAATTVFRGTLAVVVVPIAVSVPAILPWRRIISSVSVPPGTIAALLVATGGR